MSVREELLIFYDISEARVDLLLKANPTLTASEIADQNCLELQEYVSLEELANENDS